MVKFLSSWIQGIAVAVILVSIFEMILPEGNIKKYIKIILGIYVVFSIISPFVYNKQLYTFDISNVFDKYYSKSVSSSQDRNDNIDTIYINTLEKEITNKTEEQGFIVKNCKIKGVFNTESEDIGISEISLNLSGKKNNIEKNEVSNVEEVNKVEINIGNTNSKTISQKSITDADINELKEYLSKYYEIDKNIIYIN